MTRSPVISAVSQLRSLAQSAFFLTPKRKRDLLFAADLLEDLDERIAFMSEHTAPPQATQFPYPTRKDDAP